MISRPLRVAFYVALASALLPVYLRLLEYAFDDAYIHMRVAGHLLTAGEPYFNLGDPIMASSSPAWTLVLAALFAVTGVSPAAISVVNVLCTVACVWVFARLLHQASGWREESLAVDVVSAVIIAPVLAASGIGLMETPFALLMAGTAMLLFERSRPAAFSVFAVAAFVRVELAVLGTAFAIAAVATHRMRVRDVLVHGAFGALPLLTYDLYFFGTVVPSAIRAKSIGYDVPRLGTLVQLVPYAADGGTPVILALLWPLAVAAGAYLVLRAPVGATARASVLSGVAIAVTYLVTRALVFEWYIPLYGVLIAWPVASVLMLPSLELAAARARRLLSAGIVLVVAGPAQVGMARYLRGAALNAAYAPAFLQGARVQRYIDVGHALFARLPHHTLLTSEIGGLGYGFRGRIDDGFGIVSPAAVAYHPLRVPDERSSGFFGAIPPGYIDETNPPIVVSYDIFIQAFLRSTLADRYVRVEIPLFRPADVALAEQAGTPLDLWGIRTMNVFFRQDVYEEWRARGGDRTTL